jgi:hypothetical protein
MRQRKVFKGQKNAFTLTGFGIALDNAGTSFQWDKVEFAYSKAQTITYRAGDTVLHDGVNR